MAQRSSKAMKVISVAFIALESWSLNPPVFSELNPYTNVQGRTGRNCNVSSSYTNQIFTLENIFTCYWIVTF